jgi:CubicO group peptidase (beta-lactamase class C family)
MLKKLLLPLLCCSMIVSATAQLSAGYIDTLVASTLKTFSVPGIAVGIVKDGKLIFAKGYGVRSLTTQQPVTPQTLFGIASNSKAFTATALGMLADAGKLKWDDKVTDYLPEFQLFDPYVTREFTVRDLLTHRSGLGLGSGDLMFFPDGGNFTRAEAIHNIRFLRPVSSFRSKYDYDNNLYMVAGEIVKKISGLEWEDFIEQRIMQPVGMISSVASWNRIKNNTNVIDAHAPADGKVIQIPHDWNPIVNAAGGIMSNIDDLGKWLILQMKDGQLASGTQLISKKNHGEMQQLQTVIPTGPGYYNTHFYGYGLGWFLADVKGYKQVSHTGGLAGTVTQITMLPELNLGIIVLTNQQQGAAFSTITNTIKDSYLGLPDHHWLDLYGKRYVTSNQQADSIKNASNATLAALQKNKGAGLAPLNITGTYQDAWFGKVSISNSNGKLEFLSEKSPRLKGELFRYSAATYIVKWYDRSLDADAYCVFVLDKEGKPVSFTMEAISPLTDFSFDFQDLLLKKQ